MLTCEDVSHATPASPLPRVPDKTENLSGSSSDDPEALGGTSHTLKDKNVFHYFSDHSLGACKAAIWQVRELAEYLKTPQSAVRSQRVRDHLLAEMEQLHVVLSTLRYRDMR